MSVTPLSSQRTRPKQVPVDVWSTREKLALAASVFRSGDQNWYSVSRPLKAFGETNRPQDWFSQKNCALQYTDMLEKVETPKRKRGERGEETAQDLIVRKLTQERIEELKKLVVEDRETCRQLKAEVDLVRSEQVEDKQLQEFWERMQRQERDKEAAEVEHLKWLKEREQKFAALKATRHGLIALKARPVPVPVPLPVKVEPEPGAGSPLGEPLSIEVEDSPISTLATTGPPISLQGITEHQVTVTPISAPPSTSPLLTSLLQSPSPVTPGTGSGPPSVTIISSGSPVPTKEATSPLKQSPSTPTHSFFNPNSALASAAARQLGVTGSVASPPNLPPLFSPGKSGDRPLSPVKSPVPGNAPTLSKLLEMPPSTPGKLPPLPVVESLDVKDKDKPEKPVDDEQSAAADVVKQPPIESLPSNWTPVEAVQKSPIKVEVSVPSEETSEPTEESEPANREAHQATEFPQFSEEKSSSEVVKEESILISKEIKQEIIEKDTSDENTLDDEVTAPLIQGTAQESESASEILELKTPGGPSSRSKRKRPVATPATVPLTAIVTRRSGRVKAIREQKEEGEPTTATTTPTSTPTPTPQPPAQQPTPIEAKKSSTTDETTDASLESEESMEGLKASASKAPSISESVPNSPASSTMHSEDAENLREYKLWKKSITLLWRQAATHKFSSLFLHPVTDDEADGYSTVVYRPIDLTSIRKRIENGSIRSTTEFQRDIMLMFQNAIMYNSADHDVHQMAVEMQKEILEGIEDFIETQQQQGTQEASKIRGRERRSGVSSTPVVELPEETNPALRRKSRTSTDTDPGTSGTPATVPTTGAKTRTSVKKKT